MVQKSSLFLAVLLFICASISADSGLVNTTPVESLSPLAEPCSIITPQAALFEDGDRELWLWREEDVDASEPRRIRAARVDGQGEIAPDFLDVSQDPSVSVGDFRIDQSPGGDLWVAWTARDDDPTWSIRVRPLGRLEDPMPPPTVIPSDLPVLDVDVAAAPGGHALAAWVDSDFEQDESRIVFRPLSDEGEALDASRVARSVSGRLGGVAVAALSDTEFLVAWSEAEEPGATRLRARRLINVGSADEPDFVGFLPFPINDGSARQIESPEVVVLPDGGFAVAWYELQLDPTVIRVLLRLYDADGDPLGPPVSLQPDERAIPPQRPGLTVDSGGLVVATWSSTDPDSHLTRVFARRIDADGTPKGEALTVHQAESTHVAYRNPSPYLLDSGEVLVLWDEGEPESPILPPRCFGGVGKRILARRLLTTCGPDDGLCLRDQRFQVEVSWNDPLSGDSGVGNPVALTSDTGLFWFFDADNLELVTKVIDGRPVNGKYWFFYGALSNLGYEISVTDRLTGEVRRYENPAGNFASFGDVRAFPRDDFLSFDPKELDAGPGTLDRLAFPAPPEASHPISTLCDTTATQLCLNERFSVTVEWEDFRSGDAGMGETIPLTRDTGSFWFFDENNVELVVKVLDARPVNGHFWVFYGSLTDVGFTLTIRDEAEGTERTFTNSPGRMASDADIRAFE